MSLIQVTDLTFGYDGSYDLIFDHATFRFDTDWRLGFVGRNGRGKTTFLRLLRGEHPYQGSIRAQIDFASFPCTVPDNTLPTLELLATLAPDCPEWQLVRELNLLALTDDVFYRPFSTLSHGEQTKAMLAALFLREHSFLLIDEPTNHLDALGRALLADYLRTKQGFLLISHDRAFLDACTDHTLSINRANIEVQKGNFSSWWENKQQRDQFEANENDRLKRDIHHLQEAARRTATWSDKVEKTKYATRDSGLRPDRGYIGHKAAKMMQRAKAIEGRREAAADEKSKLLKNVETAEALKLHPMRYHSEVLAELSDISICYGGRAVCEHISFRVQRGDRLALQGANGSGKSSLLKLLLSEDVPHTGLVRVGGGLRISYVSQCTAHLCGTLTEYTRARGIDDTLCKAILRKLDFARVQFEKDMTEFSDGQKKKVLLAASLCEQAHLYVWDEPLNYIDVLSRMQIEQLILEFSPTLLFVEHDAAFCENVATGRVFL